MARRWSFYVRVLRAEGLAGTLARLRGRLAFARSLTSFRPGRAEELRALGVPLVNVLPVSRKRTLGGVQVQLAARLEREARERAVALLFPHAGRQRLEVHAGERRLQHDCGPAGSASEFADALTRALELLGTRALHLENLATFGAHGLLAAEESLALLAALPARGAGARVASLHDYAAFCPRPFQVERPAERFCGFVRDAARCARCCAGALTAGQLERQRAAAHERLGRLDALVCPSDEMRARLIELFPAWRPERLRVIAPGSGTPVAPRAPAWPPRHVAIVGATRLEKGAAVAAALVPRLKALGLAVSAHGGAGDAQALRALRQAGARQCGSYAPGALPARLNALAADLCVLPTIGPETYSLALDECWAAGLPVVAFDVGAAAARVRAWGGGALVPLARGADGLYEAIRALCAQPAAPGVPQGRLPAPDAAARAHLGLYAELGLLPG